MIFHQLQERVHNQQGNLLPAIPRTPTTKNTFATTTSLQQDSFLIAQIESKGLASYI